MVQLPPELEALIFAGVVFLVTEGLKVVSGWLGFDLSGAGAAIAAGLVAAVVALLNGLLGAIPPQFADIANAVLSLIIILLGAFGIHRQSKRGK